MSDLALHDRRGPDVELAIVRTQLDNHLASCEAAHKTVDFRLSRIEKGILATLVTILLGGASTMWFLLKIVLHLG